jgi:hypothetical protein
MKRKGQRQGGQRGNGRTHQHSGHQIDFFTVRLTPLNDRPVHCCRDGNQQGHQRASKLCQAAAKADLAAAALRLTATDLMEFGVVDEVVAEDTAWEIDSEDDESSKRRGAFQKTANRLKDSIIRNLNEVAKLGPSELVKARYDRFRKIGSAA